MPFAWGGALGRCSLAQLSSAVVLLASVSPQNQNLFRLPAWRVDVRIYDILCIRIRNEVHRV